MAACPLCGIEAATWDGYVAHLADAHDLVDDEGAASEPPAREIDPPAVPLAAAPPAPAVLGATGWITPASGPAPPSSVIEPRRSKWPPPAVTISAAGVVALIALFTQTGGGPDLRREVEAARANDAIRGATTTTVAVAAPADPIGLLIQPSDLPDGFTQVSPPQQLAATAPSAGCATPFDSTSVSKFAVDYSYLSSDGAEQGQLSSTAYVVDSPDRVLDMQAHEHSPTYAKCFEGLATATFSAVHGEALVTHVTTERLAVGAPIDNALQTTIDYQLGTDYGQARSRVYHLFHGRAAVGIFEADCTCGSFPFDAVNGSMLQLVAARLAATPPSPG